MQFVFAMRMFIPKLGDLVEMRSAKRLRIKSVQKNTATIASIFGPDFHRGNSVH